MLNKTINFGKKVSALASAVMLAVSPQASVANLKQERLARRDDVINYSDRAQKTPEYPKSSQPKDEVSELINQEERRKWEELKYLIITNFLDHGSGVVNDGLFRRPEVAVVSRYHPTYSIGMNRQVGT